MHHYMSMLFWWNVGKYGAIGAFLAGGWLVRRRWFPHKHDGYVSLNGYVHACSRCSRLPAGAIRTGFYGMNPDSPEAQRYDALKKARLEKADGEWKLIGCDPPVLPPARFYDCPEDRLSQVRKEVD